MFLCFKLKLEMIKAIDFNNSDAKNILNNSILSDDYSSNSESEEASDDPSCINIEAIQLISKNSKDDLVINDAALEIIKNIEGKIAVFMVVGPYRQGKSYILNRLIDSNCFKVGHTDNSCTKGLWMPKKTFKHLNSKGEPLNVIYFDTEV